MGKVLVINDSDGHCHVFDASTEKQETALYRKLLHEYILYLKDCGRGKIDDDDIDFVESIKSVIDQEYITQMEVSDILDERMDDFPGFDRSNGGRMYVVDFSSVGNESLKKLSRSLFL